jgi:hypothetical protein
MNLSLWALKHALKEQGRGLVARGDRWRYPRSFAAPLGDAEAGAWIAAALRARKPVLVGRLGAVESRLLGEARWRGGRFSRVTLRQAHVNAGLFPLEPTALAAAADRLGSALAAVDLLARWDSPYQARLVDGLDPMPQLSALSALEPWWQPQPWSAALAGLRVLVVHPFVASIEAQWRHRQSLFRDPAVLPSFALQTLRPPQTLGGAREGYSSWGAALDSLILKVAALEFDVALLGCGAYGLPLGAAIKAQGRAAVHLGGALQLLFGIQGRRWEAIPRYAALSTAAWVRPLPDETPAAAALVDGGCYW